MKLYDAVVCRALHVMARGDQVAGPKGTRKGATSSLAGIVEGWLDFYIYLFFFSEETAAALPSSRGRTPDSGAPIAASLAGPDMMDEKASRNIIPVTHQNSVPSWAQWGKSRCCVLRK